MRVPCCYYSLY